MSAVTTQHYDYKIVSKTKGHNLIAKVSYNSRSKVFDEEENIMKYSHTSNKDHVDDTMVILPDGAPEKFHNPRTLWNEVKRREPGRQAKNLKIAIPHEFIKRIGDGPLDYDFSEGKNLVLEHLNKEFVSKGYPCQVDFHLSYNKKNEPNFHAHVLVAERQLINGQWVDAKSHKIYLDEKDNIIQPIQSPKLLFGKLMYKDNKIVMEPGYKILQYDQDGKPLLDKRGYPVTKDIRVPIVSKRKDGKKEWKERKKRNTDIDDKGNVKRLRKAWEVLQNEYYKKLNIRTENGEILQVDHRPFKEKYKDIPPELRPEPTKRAKYGILKESILEYNKSVMERRRLIKTALEKEAQIRTKKFIFNQKKINELDAIIEAENNFCRDINPKKLYIDRWETNYNSLKSQVEEHDKKVIDMLRRNLNYNQKQRSVIDKTDKYKTEKNKRLKRHAVSMQKIINGILSFRNNNIDIVSLAGQSYNRLNNAKKVAFIKSVIGDKTAKIYASFLTRNNPDKSDALDGLIAKPPAIPDERANSKLIENATEAIAGEKSISIDWNTLTGEAPPKKVIDSVNSYHTALAFYDDKLNSSNQWRTRTVIDSEKIETPEKINQDFEDEISKIANSDKDVSFSGTVEERIKQARIIYEKTRAEKIPYSQDTKDLFGLELKNIKKDLVEKVVMRLSPLQRAEILKNCPKNSTLPDNEKITNYLDKLSGKLKTYAENTGCQDDHKLYKDFGEINKYYFGLQNKTLQQTQQPQQQKDGQDLGR